MVFNAVVFWFVKQTSGKNVIYVIKSSHWTPELAYLPLVQTDRGSSSQDGSMMLTELHGCEKQKDT